MSVSSTVMASQGVSLLVVRLRDMPFKVDALLLAESWPGALAVAFLLFFDVVFCSTAFF